MRSAFVEARHALDAGFHVGGVGLPTLEGGRHDACAEGFGQQQSVTDLRAAFGEDAVRVDHARDGEAVFRFVVGDGVPPRDDGPGLAYFLRAAAQDFGQNGLVQLFGEGGNVDGEEVPIYDLSAIMDVATLTPDSRNRKVMLVKVQGRDLALLVDQVERAVEVDSDFVEQLPPIFTGPPRDCFPKVLRREDELILILSPEGLGKIAKHQEEA